MLAVCAVGHKRRSNILMKDDVHPPSFLERRRTTQSSSHDPDQHMDFGDSQE
jgi:hypothetical protein